MPHWMENACYWAINLLRVLLALNCGDSFANKCNYFVLRVRIHQKLTNNFAGKITPIVR
jgi:hypothetical protein